MIKNIRGLSNNGLKDDKHKIRWDLMPFDILDDAAEILTMGAAKYEANNWQKVESFRYHGALMRHFSAYMQGEKYDKESGKSHLAHALCNVMFLLWKEKHDADEEI